MGIRIKGLDSVRRELEKKINIFTVQFNQKLGKMARDLIYKRVKSGYGVTSLNPDVAQQTRLKKLSPSYIEQRQGKAAYFTKSGKVVRVPAGTNFKPKKPKLGAFGAPGRSNLTLSGQMLEAIRYEANARGVKVFIDNSARDDGYTNAEIAEFVQKARPFFILTRDELTVLVREIEREIKKVSRR